MRNGLWQLNGVLVPGGYKSATDEDVATAEMCAKDAHGNGIPKISGVPLDEVIVEAMYEFEPFAKDLENDKLQFEIRDKPDRGMFDDATERFRGQPLLSRVDTCGDFTISVSEGRAKSSLPAFSIDVNHTGQYSATPGWRAPTKDQDGSTLTDLAGYRMYYGRQAG